MIPNPLAVPMCRECEGPMTLLGSWAGSLYVPPGQERIGAWAITSRHFLCDVCRIPLRAHYCPTHQKRLVVGALPVEGGARVAGRRPHRCPERGCRYEKSRDEALLLVR